MKPFLVISFAFLFLSCRILAMSLPMIEEVYQFDRSSMIQQKIKKAQDCIKQGNYKAAKNYLDGVLKLDKNNSKAKELLRVCANEGKPTSNQSSSNISSYLTVSKSELNFSSKGGSETITISTNNSWEVSVKPNYWGHIKREGNTLTLSVDPNHMDTKRTDYIIIKAGGLEKRINITQSQTQTTNNLTISGTSREYIDNASALTNLTTTIEGWGKCRLGAITESGSGIAIYGTNGYASTGNVSSGLLNKLKELNTNKEIFKSIAMTESGYYCIVYARNGWYGAVPEKLKASLNQFNRDREEIYCVSIAENGDYVVITDKHIEASNSTDRENLKKATDLYGHIKYACGTNRGLCVVCQNGIYYRNIPKNIEENLRTLDFKPDKVVFTDSGTYLITNEDGSYSFHM